VEQYARTSRERDDALNKYSNQLISTELLAAKTKGLTEELAKIKTERESLTKQLDQYAKDAKDAPELRTRVADLAAGHERQTKTITHLEELLDTAAGREAISLSDKYQKAWYAALAGWILSGLLAVALVAGYAMIRLPAEDGDVAPTPEGNEPPPHRIV
jgi:hypothetical protein